MIRKMNLVILAVGMMQPAIAGDYPITGFGARPGELSTVAIQRAIDACHDAGGGTVVIPAGTFITGALVMKSYVNLHLETGSELRSSEDPADFDLPGRPNSGMIFAQDAVHICITGQGTLNAMGTKFYEADRNHFPIDFDRKYTRQKQGYLPEGTFFTDGPIKRKTTPGMTIVLFHCNQVTIRDITVLDTPLWAIRFSYCEDVLVEGITLQNNLLIPNSDGIHITVSRNVRISGCDISAGDDAIAITGFARNEDTPGFDSTEQERYRYGNKGIYNENIQVTNCRLQSRSSGIRVGYGQHPIRRVICSNIIISGSNRGIGIFARDAAPIEELTFSDIIIETRLHNGVWWGTGEPIHLSAITRFEGEPVGPIRDVQFNNIRATCEQGIVVYGLPETHLKHIRFNNVSLHLKKGAETDAYAGNFDLRPCPFPDKQIFEHDIPGLFAQYTDDLSIADFSLTWGKDLPAFFTHGLECVNVRDLWIENFQGNGNPDSPESRPENLEQTTFRE